MRSDQIVRQIKLSGHNITPDLRAQEKPELRTCLARLRGAGYQIREMAARTRTLCRPSRKIS